ncbi:cell surface protein SprA [Prolixibacteraceae bacterium JC049]|nr:cell surface protein SprA [Prolixibacteraceae bacterium JC049]
MIVFKTSLILKPLVRYSFVLAFYFILTAFVVNTSKHHVVKSDFEKITTPQLALSDSTLQDSIDLPYPFKDVGDFEYPQDRDSSALFLNTPSNIKRYWEYDQETGNYVIYEKVGDITYRLPKVLSLKEFLDYEMKNSIESYWSQRVSAENFERQSGGLLPQLRFGGEAFSRLFGSNVIDIRPVGTVEIKFGYKSTYNNKAGLSEQSKRTGSFDFDQNIMMNVTGKIGTKVNMRVNYNTQATFDFENRMNIDYTGEEDEIFKKIEAGNVSLPLNGTLIKGGTNLFGVKTEMQFGKLTLTTILTQHKGETKVVETEGGSQKAKFEVKASEYDANRHFFLSKYFYDRYNESLKDLPIVRSDVQITKVEVWVTNKAGKFDQARDIAAFVDLGEPGKYIHNKISAFQADGTQTPPESTHPNNATNFMYNELTTTYGAIRSKSQITQTLSPLESQNFSIGKDYEKVEQARLLKESEYTLNERLGYISLSASLNSDEVLAIAYTYTIDGKTFKVGELTSDGVPSDETLILKLLKGTTLSPKFPTWDLMMKNIYDLNAYQMEKEDFVLNILYYDDNKGTHINYLPESRIQGHMLLKVMNLDNVNSQGDAPADGVFDFINGYTVLKEKGKLIFPTTQPFGQHLADSIGNAALAKKYAYTSLYDSTLTRAQEDTEHDKFTIKGTYKGSATNEIRLNSFNLAPGSVKVTAGSQQLTEGLDYIVDYSVGVVRILNKGLLESGTKIQASVESQELFSVQRKTLIGTHADYNFSDKFRLGATAMWMNEQPITKKVNFGQEPISNLIVGMDLSYRDKSRLLTKLVDKLPFIETKETSSISLELEAAKLIPGSSKSINGMSYIDDFESTRTPIDLSDPKVWRMASIPQHQSGLFPEAGLIDDLAAGYNRARLAWYSIDPTLYSRTSSATPAYLKQNRDEVANHYVREVHQNELFPNREITPGMPTRIRVMDLAYYPDERGPYNFETQSTGYSAGMSSDGKLMRPETRWGGIMRKIESSDFETANIEYIEFWMLDPFIVEDGETSIHEGGDLYFNLGNISEDVLRDSRKSFEQGIPINGDLNRLETTKWGRVSTLPAINQTFDNNQNSRDIQDIGLDGLDDDAEKTHFSDYVTRIQSIVTNQEKLNDILADPAGDDFRDYKNAYFEDATVQEAGNAGILSRYKRYNSQEGNSPFTNASVQIPYDLPDMEDINGDKTMNEVESYFQYKVSIRKDDMVVGRNYITDELTTDDIKIDGRTTANPAQVKWYQFKIPVQDFQKRFGNIDMKSIRFARMYMRGFKQPVVLRFATLNLVRADWRRYKYDLSEKNIVAPDTQFEISAVNIEENGKRTPINYILPDGIDRVIDPANPQLRQLNEQSMVLRVKDLEPGDVRGAYKNTILDIRRYKRLIMDVHAERLNNLPIADNEMHVFLRLGSDVNNYYEYEIPLKITPPRQYNGDVKADRLAVWPEDNRFDFKTEILVNLKQERNAKARSAGSNVKFSKRYSRTINADGRENLIHVKGNPNLANVKMLMVGLRNPNASHIGAKSAEVWINELRLSDFDNKGGWAAQGRMTARLADLGSVTMAGRVVTAGFGGVDQTLNQRAKSNLFEYDIASNLELGKFFPKESGVKIPMYVGYSQSVSNPEFNPLDPDVKLKDALNNAENSAVKDSIKRASQDYSSRKSINFTNVKIDKPNKSGKPKLYDVSNFALTYAFNETNKRSINVEKNVERNYNLLLTYNYNNRPKMVSPFRNVKFLKGKAFRLIKDFNFYTMPTMLSFRTDFYRHYNEITYRNTDPSTKITLPTTYEKDFIWNRYFDIKYDLSRSLRFDLSTQGTSRIDEVPGRYDPDFDDYKAKRDTIIKNLLKGGRPTMYQHTMNVSYNLPINKLPFLDWVNSSIRYQGTYDWNAGPLSNKNVVYGNTAENTRTIQGTASLNMSSLYNKVGFLKNINKSIRNNSSSKFYSRSRSKNKKDKDKKKKDDKNLREVEYKGKNINLKANKPFNIYHKLGEKNVKVVMTGKDGKQIHGTTKVINDEKAIFTTTKDITGAKVKVTAKVAKKPSILARIGKGGLRLLLSVRNVSANYSQREGTWLPGFLPEPKFLGAGNYTPQNSVWNGARTGSSYAPGLPFVLGWQEKNFGQKAAAKGWLTPDPVVSDPIRYTYSDNFNVRATIEPINNLRINLVADRKYSRNTDVRYKYDKDKEDFDFFGETLKGNFSMTINTLGTAFEKIDGGADATSAAYNNFLDYRKVISQRLNNTRIANTTVGYTPGEDPKNPGYYDGYGPNSQQVLIPAFLAAYTDQDPEKISLSAFPKVSSIRPNWRVNYEGRVAQIEGINKFLKSLNFSHAYRSTYNVGGYTTNTDFNRGVDGFSYVRNTANNFVPDRDINSVSITEQFSPLINIDAIWVNDLTTGFEIKRSRMLSLNFANTQITEQLVNEFVVRLGYRFQNLNLFIKTKNSEKSFSNDLNVTADISFRKDRNVLRRINEGFSEVERGNRVTSINTTAEYNLSNRFSMRMFFMQTINNPEKASYYQSNSEFGMSFRFSLGQ